MSTNIRSDISKKNKYWISKHRYYELRHFCMQYPEWKREYLSIDSFSKTSKDISQKNPGGSDPVNNAILSREYYANRIELIEKVAIMTDPVLGKYVLEGIVKTYSYDTLMARYNLPCCKDVYYELYRKFFWILSKFRH